VADEGDCMCKSWEGREVEDERCQSQPRIACEHRIFSANKKVSDGDSSKNNHASLNLAAMATTFQSTFQST